MTKADEYRDKARQMRALAERTSDPRARATWLSAADHYEKLAHMVEKFPTGPDAR